MPLKTEFDSVIEFDINEYLIENYPRMTLTQRRAVCSQAIENIDMDEVMEDSIVSWVSSLAMIDAGYITFDDLEEDEEDEDED